MPVPNDLDRERFPEELKSTLMRMFLSDPTLVKLKKGTEIIVNGNRVPLPRFIMRDNKGNLYALYTFLGRGGFGDVKYAFNIKTNQWCVVKIQHAREKDKTKKLRKEIKKEERFMALFNMYFGSAERLGQPRKGREAVLAANEEIEKFYTFQPLLTGSDLIKFLKTQEPITTRTSEAHDENTAHEETASQTFYGTFFPYSGVENVNLVQELIVERGNVALEHYDPPIVGVQTLAMVLAIMRNAVNSLKVIHQKNVLHLDIKPDNMFIDQNLNVKFLDFGVSQHLPAQTQELNLGNKVLGTPGYMPPEVTAGMHAAFSAIYSKAADIYGLGVTFNDMMMAIVKQELAIPYVFNNLDNLLLVDILNDAAKLIFTMTSADRTQRSDTAKVESMIAQIQTKMQSTLFKRVLNRRTGNEGIMEALDLVHTLKGKDLTRDETIKLLREAGVEPRQAIGQVATVLARVNKKATVTPTVPAALEAEISGADEPIEYLRTHPGHFLHALELYEQQKHAALSRLEALRFAQDCSQHQLCDYKQALHVIQNKFKK